jgi:hypothetical protein
LQVTGGRLRKNNSGTCHLLPATCNLQPELLPAVERFPKWSYLASSLFKPYMEYSKIVSVTGLPGLYELLSSKTDGAIVRGLDDKATKFISSRQHNLSHLESIEVYTVSDNVNLAEIFNAMGSNAAKLPDEKTPKQ